MKKPKIPPNCQKFRQTKDPDVIWARHSNVMGARIIGAIFLAVGLTVIVLTSGVIKGVGTGGGDNFWIVGAAIAGLGLLASLARGHMTIDRRKGEAVFVESYSKFRYPIHDVRSIQVSYMKVKRVVSGPSGSHSRWVEYDEYPVRIACKSGVRVDVATLQNDLEGAARLAVQLSEFLGVEVEDQTEQSILQGRTWVRP